MTSCADAVASRLLYLTIILVTIVINQSRSGFITFITHCASHWMACRAPVFRFMCLIHVVSGNKHIKRKTGARQTIRCTAQ